MGTITTFLITKKYYNYKRNILYSVSKEDEFKNFHTKNNNDPFRRSRLYEKVAENHNISIFSGSANPELAKEVTERLGLTLGKYQFKTFSDGELNIQLHDSIRGRDAYIIQPTCPPVNDNLVELLLLISTMKRTSAKKITAVIPYYGYARADRKMSSRVPISAADVAKMLETMGVDRVVAIDLHSAQIQGFFGPSVPVDNLEAQNLMVDYVLNSNIIENYNKLVIVSPDAGGVYRAKSFAEILINKTNANINITMIVKQRIKANEVSKMELVGNVQGCDCIIIDDMIDTAGTLCMAAEILHQNGARKIFAFATHGVFSGKAIDNINKSKLDGVVVTNTIPLDKAKESPKITTLSVGILIAEAIRRIHNNESLSEVFKH